MTTKQQNKNNYQEEYNRIIQAKDVILKSLSGESEEICIDQEPFRKYCIGIITPLTEDEMGFGDEKKKWILKRRPDSIGFEARIQPFEETINMNIDVKLSAYYRIYPTYDEQLFNQKLNKNSEDLATSRAKIHLRQKYRRLDINLNKINLSIKLPKERIVKDIECDSVTHLINIGLLEAAKKSITTKECWVKTEREPTIPISSLRSPQEYEASLPVGEKELPEWKVRLAAKVWPAENGQWRLSLLITNVTKNNKAKYQVSLFNVRFSSKLNKAKFVFVPFNAAKLDYRYSTVSWGKGINCVIKVLDDGKLLQTTTTPYIEQLQILSRENTKQACEFLRLSSDIYKEALAKIGGRLNDYSTEWKKENQAFKNNPSFSLRSLSLIDFENEIKRFNMGIKALEEDKRLETAFKLMNLTFSRGKHKEWRLFQLVFIVSQIPSLLARENPDELYIKELNTVDVLWFPTGGGKTEAYFGVILTALFYDRLRGKSRGVTSWLRYPLRMLSIQQLQRLVDVIATADEIRKETGNASFKNCDPFTVGYFVGSANTPNYLTIPESWKRNGSLDPIVEWKEKIEQTSNINDLKILVLQRCPYCGMDNIKVVADVEAVRIKHICNDCLREAPIYISDSEIYRYVPSVIVGTVDRLAIAGNTSLFAHLFGKYTHRCPKHGYLSFGSCIEHTCKVRRNLFEKLDDAYDPTPALLLQDELHLLKDSLGTYDSHFETFLDLLAENSGNGLPSKKLAATATIEGYKDHVWELYGREAIRFPVKGKGEFDSAYVEQSRDDQKSRMYVGIMPTGASPEETVASIQQALKSHSIEIFNTGNWSNDIIINYDLSLVFVNEKNTAGNFGSNIDSREIEVLTGDKGLGEVRGVISRVESDHKRQYSERLKSIIATSVISHGVDLSRLNFMTFCGMPNHASDYIQASSRVGRNHFGVVFTVFRPTNNRERNIFQRFYEYHERLYQLVQPVPINRFSESSISRTLSGILSSCVLNILSYRINKKLDIANDFLMHKQSGLFNENDLHELVVKAYKIEGMNIPGSSVHFFVKLINKLIGVQKRMIENNTDRYLTYQRMKPLPVSSLREVREQLEFSVNNMRNLDIYLHVTRNKN